MLVFLYTLSILFMILLPLGFAASLRRLRAAPWLLFSLGSLTFILAQVVHIPLNNWLVTLGLLPEHRDTTIPLWQTALILGLTAGLTEELARAGGYAVLQKWKPAWLRLQDGVMLGLGHGGIESMVIGGVFTAAGVSALLPLVGRDLSALGLTPVQLENLQFQIQTLTASPFTALLPLVERVIAMSAHVVFSILVWKAFARNQFRRDWIYLVAAILYHTLLDFVAVVGLQHLSENLVLLEGLFAVVVAPGVVWLVWLARQEPRETDAHTAQGSLKAEVRVFWVATAKELRQLWRTNRLLVMAAVFLIFGMGSPLLAKLTPEILQSIEGAEQFAQFIPEPTGGDAMAQYIKNLSQFGFILAILLVMGAVAGEKERGIAPMILSKPMPRWVFIASKFTAQWLMYLGGFLLAGLGAYYYTVILFGSLDFGGFALLNGLLFLWLLPFVALGLLGSVLGGSTVAAGGIGLGLSIVLMLAGSLPRVGDLLPGGLIGWATQAGLNAAGSPASPLSGLGAGADLAGAGLFQNAANGGAAASALVIIAVAWVLALGVFEQQEL